MGKKLKKKKAKKIIHGTYNSKIFLVPESINSMAAIFTKIYKSGIAIIRISDCNNTIKLWNDLNDPDEVVEMMTKITNVQNELEKFKQEIKLKSPYNGQLK